MIAACLKLGIGKRELLEDYYLDELPILFEAYEALYKGADQDNRDGTKEEQTIDTEVGLEEFLTGL